MTPIELPALAPTAVSDTSSPLSPAPRSASWLRAARRARMLSWFSLAWMTIEGILGIIAGATSGSVALAGWGIGSAIEGFASLIVIWRFTGIRIQSDAAEQRATRTVAVSLYLLAPYVTVQASRSLIAGDHPTSSILGMAITASSIILMPGLGIIKRRLGQQLGSSATTGEAAQNLLCAAQGAAVLLGLAANAAFGTWWLDAVIALGLAAWAVKEGREAWNGEGCCAPGSAHMDAYCTTTGDDRHDPYCN